MPAFDARMGEIYCGFYKTNDDGIVEAIRDEEVITPDDLQLPDSHQWFGIGTGWQTYAELLTSRFGTRISGHKREAYPSSEQLVPLAIQAYDNGETVGAEYVRPVYLRNKVTG